MKNIYSIIVVTIIIVGTIFIANSRLSDKSLVGETILVTVFTNNGEKTSKALLQIPFLKTLKESESISVSIDLNEDGAFEENETLVSDFPIQPQANWSNGYYITSTTPITNEMNARITINEKNYDTTIETKTFEVGTLLGLASVTDPENAMKGFGIETIYAGELIEITNDNVPDLTQRTGECAPTAAANSLISLINKNGGDDLVPGDPLDFIENLKRHMNWTPENGVLPDDFVDGKNKWAAAAGVPIRTTKVGDSNGITTTDAILEALQNGDAVELRIKFGDSSGKAVGGHMVTVTGIHQGDGQTYIDINDPKTPDSGTETVEIRGNQITNYGLWEGVTVLSWGFVQTWEGHPTGALLDPMTDAEIQGIQEFVGETPTIKVIEYKGKFLPVSQLIVEEEEGCGAKHWHAASGVVTATDGTKVSDPGPQCGYGKVSNLPSRDIPITN